jgi:Tol biopolymer transport system component
LPDARDNCPSDYNPEQTDDDGNGERDACDPPEPLDKTKIAFASDRDGDRDIYTMNPDGSRAANFTENGADDWLPSWSPAGGKIVFESRRDGNLEVYAMNANGTEETNLTKTPGSAEGQPVWSPEGSEVAFWSDRDGNPELYVMRADGSEPPAHDHALGRSSRPAGPGTDASSCSAATEET